MKKILTVALCGLIVLSGCSSMKNSAKGGLIGGGAGAAIGAGLAVLFGGDARSAAIGATLGAAVGGGTGAIIGNQMDKKAEELAKLEGAKIETITDANGLTAIKVTFDSGILFGTNSTALSADAKNTLAKFATSMKDMPDTDLTIWGHTDNTGSDAVNERISKQRAQSVSAYLQQNGMNNRMNVEGKSYSMPVADNGTPEGRAQNRRVEVYVSANADMVKAAEAAANGK